MDPKKFAAYLASTNPHLFALVEDALGYDFDSAAATEVLTALWIRTETVSQLAGFDEAAKPHMGTLGPKAAILCNEYRQLKLKTIYEQECILARYNLV